MSAKITKRIWQIEWEEGLDAYELHGSGWKITGPEELDYEEKVTVIEYPAYEKLKSALEEIVKNERNWGHQPHVQAEGDLISTLESDEMIAIAKAALE